MKTLNVYLISFCLLILSIPLKGQSSMAYGFKASYVLNGFMETAPLEGGIDENVVIPGLSFTLGMKHAYYFNQKKNIQLGFGLLFEHNAFSRLKKWAYDDGGASYRKERYRKHSIIAPLDVEFRIKKISFSVGLVASTLFHLNLSEHYCYSPSTSICDFEEYYSIQFRINREYRDNNSNARFTNEDSKLAHRFSLQYLFGIHYQVSNRIKLGLEFRDYPFDNHFTVTRFDWDIFTTTDYDHQTNAIDLSVQYFLN